MNGNWHSISHRSIIRQPPDVPAGLANNITFTNRTRITIEHANAWQNFYKQESVQSVIVARLVLEAIDSDYIKELEDEYLGYSRETVKSVLAHVKTNYCTITTLDKNEAKDDFKQLWNGQGHITKFARNLDQKQEWCIEINVDKTDCTWKVCMPSNYSTTRTCKSGRTEPMQIKHGPMQNVFSEGMENKKQLDEGAKGTQIRVRKCQQRDQSNTQ